MQNHDLEYTRNIKRRLFLYRLTYLFLIASTFTIFLSGQYVYLFFLLVVVFIRDFIFLLEEISINRTELIITRWFLGGTIKTKRIFKLDKIISLNNNDAGVTGETLYDPEYVGGVGFTTGENTTREFQKYLLTYFDKRNCPTQTNVLLSEYEARLIVT